MQRSLASHQRWHFYLPRTLAGSGVQPAKLRRAAALLGSWELCLHDVASAVGLSSAEAVRPAFRLLWLISPRPRLPFVRLMSPTPLTGRAATPNRTRKARSGSCCPSTRRFINGWRPFSPPTTARELPSNLVAVKVRGPSFYHHKLAKRPPASATSTFVQFCALAFVATTPAMSSTLGRRLPRTANTYTALSTRFVQVSSAGRLWT